MDWNAHVWTMMYSSVAAVDTVEWACALVAIAFAFKMTEQVHQWICNEFCVKLEYSSMETIQMIRKATAMGKWRLPASSPQCTRHASCLVQSFLAKHQINHVTQPLYSPYLVPCDFWLFPKLKSPLNPFRFQVVDKNQGNMTGIANVHWENYVRSQGAYFEGDWGILVLCTMFLVSSSINVSIFHITWLDTLWTAFAYDTQTQTRVLW